MFSFTMWPSAQSWNWNSVDVGPHRDLLGDLLTAARAANLHAGVYFSIYEWYHPFYTGPNPEKYVDEILIPQFYDLVNTYKPEILWCDG
jgi:alpha-L-fucosidase